MVEVIGDLTITKFLRTIEESVNEIITLRSVQ